MQTGPRLPGRAALWAPVVLALGLGLASAQRTLEEVPVQPGFDVQKVTLTRPRRSPGTRTWWLVQGDSPRPALGQGTRPSGDGGWAEYRRGERRRAVRPERGG